MNVLDLFSGIGGFSLGLERAGMRTVAFCEIDPYCRAVLAKHWPSVRCYTDIRELTATRLVADVWHRIEVICGGFPCQDVSVAGARGGLEGTRSGLWSEYARLIGELRPRYAIVENTPGLLSLGMDEILGDLAALRYDAQWYCIPASYLGAHHIRERVWIIAYPDSSRELQPQGPKQKKRGRSHHGAAPNPPHSDRSRLQERLLWPAIQEAARQYVDGKNTALDPWGAAESAVVRGVHGIPNRVDRIGALGNAVVPQIAEIIGRAIMQQATSTGNP